MAKAKLLTFEMSKDRDSIEIHANEEGIRDLIYYLQRLAGGTSPPPKHEHLMTPEWGGHELTQTRQGADSTLINQVTIFCWPGN
jgi:hypothetical protein